MTQKLKVLALGGDGIGPEVLSAGLSVLDVAAKLAGLSVEICEDLLHGQAWDAHGTFCREETLTAAKAADATLVGGTGGAKWDSITVPGGPEMQDGLMRLRKGMNTVVGMRPAKVFPALGDATAFRPDVIDGADIMVLREMCSGTFFSEPRGIHTDKTGVRTGIDTTSYTEAEIAHFARSGFELARRRRGKVMSADKANVMESGVLWRDVVSHVGHDYPDVQLTHFYADNASYQLNRRPCDFDVILSDNLFGDMLSDQVAALAGSLGMLPSACLQTLPPQGERAGPALYEPVHGTAPDIVGQGIANPIGMILSVAMAFEYGFAAPETARRIEIAVSDVLDKGVLTPDLGGTARTQDVTDGVIAELRR